MIGLNLKTTKETFFDTKRVRDAVGAAARRVLSKFGAYVMTAARSSIRKRKRRSAPGEPPSSHTGLLKHFILFGYDVDRRSVVIGPARLNQKHGDAPESLEYGGVSTILTGSRRRGRGTRRVVVAARPFMRPALGRELPKLPAMWRDSVK